MKIAEMDPLVPIIISIKQNRKRVVGLLKDESMLNKLIKRYVKGENIYVQYLDEVYTPEEFKRREDINVLNRLDTAITTGKRILHMKEMFQ